MNSIPLMWKRLAIIENIRYEYQIQYSHWSFYGTIFSKAFLKYFSKFLFLNLPKMFQNYISKIFLKIFAKFLKSLCLNNCSINVKKPKNLSYIISTFLKFFLSFLEFFLKIFKYVTHFFQK